MSSITDTVYHRFQVLSPGTKISGGLHFFALIIAIFGLPYIIDDTPLEPSAMIVELLPVGEKTNIRPPAPKVEPKQKPAPPPRPAPPKEKPAPAKEPEIKAEPLPEPKPAEKPKAEPKPEPKAEKKPNPEPKVEEKPQPAQEEKPKKSKEEEEAKKFSDIINTPLRDIEKEAASTSTSSPAAEPSTSTSSNYDPSLPLTLSEIDAIREQVTRNWSYTAGGKDVHKMKVKLRIRLLPDGTVIDAVIIDRLRAATDSTFAALAESARRAVLVTKRIERLPVEKYNRWKEVELNFYPPE